MQVYLKALGCRLNEAELQSWGQQFVEFGYQVSTSVETADLLVLNSCAVTGEAARKSRQLLRRMHRQNPEARIVVTGCYASLDESEAASILGVDLVVPNSRKDNLVEIVNEQFHFEEQLVKTMPAFATEPGESALFSRNKDRAFIKVQDGCRYRCSYCIVTVARGDERSRTIEDLVVEINQYSQDGINEIVLTGVHVGGYGSDLGITLYDLVDAILKQTEMKRIRFASVEPWDLGEDFFELFKNPRLMPHMHLPLQSGNNAVLRRMRRRCNQQSFEELVSKARRSVPDFNVTTDIIVGFPGETEEEWQDSFDFVSKIGFGHIHIFSYSHREGTKAAKLPDALNNQVKKQRSKQLSEAAKTMKHDSMLKMTGRTTEVLWESGYEVLDNGLYRFSGYTPNYHRVKVDCHKNIAGQIMEVTLMEVNKEGYITGKLSETGLNDLQDVIVVRQV